MQDSALLGELFTLLSAKDRLIERTQRLAGRWVLFVETSDYSIAMHDACGLRRLFYSTATCGDLFCASEALTAAKVFKLERDSEAVEGFENTTFARENPEYWWPGDATQFKGVLSMLPNHYLDLRTREAVRYGLSLPIGALALGESAELSAKYLAGLIRGAALRFDLALPMTAGWDSRTVLAACRAVSVMPHCYTLRFGAMSAQSQDIAVPAKLLAKMRWTHHVIDCTTQPTREFVSMYRDNVDPAHDEACQLAFALWSDFPHPKVTLSGHCSEVARNFYVLQQGGEISPEVLADITGMNRTKFVLDRFDRWLAGAKPASESAGIRLLDLFYWEQRAGRWAANGQSQWDLVHERFTPFNCRPLLFALLAAPERHRKAPDYRLYRSIIRQLSASVLSEPINPQTATRASTWPTSLRTLSAISTELGRKVQGAAANFRR